MPSWKKDANACWRLWRESSWRHLKTTEDLFDSRSSPRTEPLVAAAVQWAERIMRKIDCVFAGWLGLNVCGAASCHFTASRAATTFAPRSKEKCRVLSGLQYSGCSQISIRPGAPINRCELREGYAEVDPGLHRAVPPIARDQPRHLRPAPARHLGQIEPDQSSRPTALLVVLLEAQHLFDPVVNLRSAFALESDGLAGL
jgi:hypothetical protein